MFSFIVILFFVKLNPRMKGPKRITYFCGHAYYVHGLDMTREETQQQIIFYPVEKHTYTLGRWE